MRCAWQQMKLPYKREYKHTYERLYMIGALLMLSIAVLGTLKLGYICPSISQFYYTPAQDILEAGLFSVAVVFAVNSGYNGFDRLINTMVALGCVGVICFPCESLNYFFHIPFQTLHYSSAATIFFSFGTACLFVFPQHRTKYIHYINEGRKRVRNVIYRTCGIVIYIGLIGFFILPHYCSIGIMICECWMVLFSAIGYLVQGKIILKDR